MSLVNDMLRDLDKRHGKDTGSEAPRIPLSRGRPVHYGWVCLSAFVSVALILWAGFYAYGDLGKAPAKAVKIHAGVYSKKVAWVPEPLTSAVAGSGEALSVPSLRVAIPAVNAQVDKLKSHANRQKVHHYLALARTALAADQLTRPVNNSAYLFYQQVLVLEPHNAAAQAGLKKIAARYTTLARRAQQQQALSRAHNLLARAQAVVPDYRPAIKLQKALNRTAVSARAPSSTVAAQEKLSIKDKVVEQASTDKVSLTLRSQDGQAVERARQQVARGNEQQAIAELQAFLTGEGHRGVKARRYLQSLWLERGARSQAKALIVPDLPKGQRAYLHAKLQVDAGELTAALTTLAAAANSAAHDQAYRALLASLYQQTGHYAAAQNYYQQLLEVFGKQARYWLGLALALDAQQQYNSAKVSYLKAARARDASASIQSFAQQRLSELGQ